MRARRLTPALALPVVLLLGGCGYVHIGKLPEPKTTVMGDDKLMQENSDLRAEKKILQQELALQRAQGDALRQTIENRTADGDTSRKLTEKLTETTRELATLRASLAALKAERDTAFASAGESSALRARLGATEQELAVTQRARSELEAEVGRLRSDVEKARTENLALSEQVKTISAQNEQAQAAVAQLNTQLLAQKDARVRAEQDAETLRTQLASSTANASTLAQQRTAAAAEARSLAAEQAQEIVTLRKDLDDFRAKVSVLEAERTQLKQQLATNPPADLANLEAKLATAERSNSQLRSENDVLKATSAQLTATRADLEAQLDRLKTAPASAQVDSLRTQLRDAQAAATALTEENAQLKSRLASSRTRVVSAEPVTRINLDAPAPTAPRAASPGGESNPSPAAESSETPRASSNGAITRPNGGGVSATLVTTVPGGTRAAPAAPQGGGRVHVVAGGDTLSKISTLYYGTPSRWNEILAANRDILGENNNLVIGRTLRIP